MMKSSRATGDFIFFHFFMQSLQQSSLPNELGSLSLLWLDLESRYFFGGIVLVLTTTACGHNFLQRKSLVTPRNAQLGSSCVGFVF